MRKPVTIVISVVALLLVGWFSLIGFAWNRNAPPKIVLPGAEAMPADNVYEAYVKCVAGLQPGDKGLIADFGNRVPLSPAATVSLLERNNALLSTFHQLPGKPCMVTQMEPGASFTPAQEFPLLNWLVGVEAENYRGKKDPARALNSLLDGLTFSEDILRGGATLQLGTTLMVQMPITHRLPTLLADLPAPVCEQGAERVKNLITTQYPLKKIMESERLVQVRRLIRATEPMSTRLLRGQIPASENEWNALLKPKSEAIIAANNYLQQWSEQAEKPLSELSPPAFPESTKVLTSDTELQPGAVGLHLYRYRYKEARLHLIYTALRIEAHKKKVGQYPTTLADLGSDTLLNDPFGGKPLVYRRNGNSFLLYSVGMNLKDDNNAPEPSMRSMGPDSSCDISFIPALARPLRRGS